MNDTKKIGQNPIEKSLRGFASMDPKEHRKLASKGGANVPAEKRSFSTVEGLASSAGKKGGKNVPAEKRSFNNKALASEAGRKGGTESQKRRRK